MSAILLVGGLLLLQAGTAAGGQVTTWKDSATDQGELQEEADRQHVKLGFVDLEARQWHMPDTKNGRSHTIHLSDFALRQFSLLRRLRESCAWIFPNFASTGPLDVKTLAKQLADRQRTDSKRLHNRTKAMNTLNLPGGQWTPHDLRRTSASLMASLGFSGDVIDECLNHQIQSRVRRTYIRTRREADQMLAFDALGSLLSELADSPIPAHDIQCLHGA